MENKSAENNNIASSNFLEKNDFEFIKQIEKKSKSWFNKNRLKILNCKVQSALYNHAGRFNESIMTGSNLKEFEEQRLTNGYDEFNNLVPAGLLNIFPYNTLSNFNSSNNIEYGLDIVNLVGQIKDNLVCLNLPFFKNYLKPVINSILGGCKKGTINCRFMNAPNDKTENVFFDNLLNSQINLINKEWDEKILTIQHSLENSQQISQNLSQENPVMQNEIQTKQALLSTLNIGKQQEISKIQQNFQTIKEQHNNLMSLIRIISDKCAEIINHTLSDAENYNNIFNALKNSVTYGIAVLNIAFDENKNIVIENFNKPETAFFDTRAKKNDKSDGRYCGIITHKPKTYIQDQYNISDEKIAILQNFTPDIQMESFFYNGIGEEKNFLIICEYFEKDLQTGKIYKTVCCKNQIFEKKILLEEYSNLFPFFMIDTVHSDEYKVDTLLQDFFSEQKNLNAQEFKLTKQKLNSSSSKIAYQVDSVDGPMADQIRSQTCQDLGYVLMTNTNSSLDVMTPPITLQGTTIDPYFSQSFETNRQNFENRLDKYILNNQINNSQTNQLGVLSGTAIENNQLNRENILAQKIEGILQVLKKIFNSTVIKNFTKVFATKNSSNYAFSPIDKFLIENISKNEKDINKMLSNINFDLDWIIDSSMRRNKALQSLKETLQIIPQDNPAIKVIMYEIIQNLDLPNGSNSIIELMEEAYRKPKEEPINPEIQLKTQELQMISQQNQANNQLEILKLQTDNDNKKQDLKAKLDIENQKQKTDYQKHLDNMAFEKQKLMLNTEVSFANSIITHHNNLSQKELADSIEYSKKLTNKEIKS